MTIVNNTVDGNTTTGQKNAMDDVIKVRRGATATIKNTLVASTSADALKAKDLADATDSKRGRHRDYQYYDFFFFLIYKRKSGGLC